MVPQILAGESSVLPGESFEGEQYEECDVDLVSPDGPVLVLFDLEEEKEDEENSYFGFENPGEYQLVRFQQAFGPQPEILAHSFIQMAAVIVKARESEVSEKYALAFPEEEDAEEEEAESNAETEDSPENDEGEPEKREIAPKKTLELSPEMVQVYGQIRASLEAHSKKPPVLQNNSPADIINYAYIFGAETQVLQMTGSQPQQRNQRQPATTSTPIYAIGSLCWNYPAAGRTLLRTDGDRVVAKIGPGLQRKQGTFLSMLAMSSIAENYEIKVQERTFSVADLVRSEKDNCSLDADMSLTLIGLSFYNDCEESWTSQFGESWSIPKIVLAELTRPADQGSSQITDQLLGLACAVRRFENEELLLSGPMLDAKKYLDSYIEFALSAQNDQNLWHPKFFMYKGSSPDVRETLYSSGHIFRFLAFYVPDEKLPDPRLLRSAKALLASLGKIAATPANTERQYEAITTTLHGLSLYTERLKEFIAE